MHCNSRSLPAADVDDTFGPLQRHGVPFLFVFRDMLAYDRDLQAAVARVQAARRTVDLLVGLGDGVANTAVGIKYSSTTATVYNATTMAPLTAWHPRFKDMMYWAMDWDCPTFDRVMAAQLEHFHGNVTAENLLRVVLPTVNTGNLHVAIYDWSDAAMYVANAQPAGATAVDAYLQPYTRLDMLELLAHKQQQ